LSCGLACILTSLAYAEFASRIPVAGSAFTYVYVAFGEFYAWVVGWNLVLGYGFTASVAARAWGDYTANLLMNLTNQHYPWIEQMAEFSLFGTLVDYTCSPLSLVIIGLSTWVLSRGAKDSSRFSNMVTILNLGILSLVIVAGLASDSITTENLIPFAPHGFPSILQGAGLVFFAFIGFDMVASLSEEVIHPERSMPIGIVGSLITTTLIYVSVSLAVVGMAPFGILGDTVPVVNALLANACCTHDEQLLDTAVHDCLSASGCETYARPWLGLVSSIVALRV
jgi:basic amino acid/polyamine antiporter, APA family